MFNRNEWAAKPENVAKRKKYQQENVDLYRSYVRKYAMKNPEKGLLKTAKHRAIKRGIEFNIDLSDIVIPDVCPILGIPLVIADGTGKAGGRMNSPSLDRIDNTKGYVKGNIRWATDEQQARNKGKMRNNTSGKTGVHFDEKMHPNGKNTTTYAVATWHDFDNKQHRKHFSTKKYGLLEAFAMACAYRDAKIEELNEQGAEYSSTHGK